MIARLAVKPRMATAPKPRIMVSHVAGSSNTGATVGFNGASLSSNGNYVVFYSTGGGLGGLLAHLHHEWVILANLLCLLVGFAILARHFEDSRVPEALPRVLPRDWKGGFVLLVLIFVLSGFLDNIAAALIGAAVLAVGALAGIALFVLLGAEFTAVTVPPIGAYRSLAAFTDSTTAAAPPLLSDLPTSGTSTNTRSPSAPCA